MQIIKLNKTTTIENLTRGGVFTLGNFDGVHKGHQKLLEETKTLAKNNGAVNNWGVITFAPNTKLCFKSKFKNYEILSDDSQKIELFRKYKVPIVIVIDFKDICNLAAKEFISRYLINILGVKALLTGSNARLGNDLLTIKEALSSSKRNKILYQEVDLLTNEAAAVYSSSHIKNLIHEGKIKEANQMLGHNYAISGTVIHGNKLGRLLGFPTANMLINNYAKPLYGIYATKVTISEQKNLVYKGVSSFGVRPTIKDSNGQEILEAHIFDFEGDIYGQTITIEFIDFLRKEEKYNTIEELKNQIKLDIAAAQSILAKQ